MKRALLLLMIGLLLASTASGIYDPNNTHTNDTGGENVFTATHSGSSASASTGGSGATSEEDGIHWAAEVSMTDRSQNLSAAGTLDDVTFEQTFVDRIEGDSETRYKVSFTGYTQVPTPCHVIDHEVTEQDDGSFVLTLTASPPGDDRFCAQVVTLVEYEASFETGEPFNLTVNYGTETVDTLKWPQPEQDPGLPADPHRQGWMTGLWNWLQGLF